jgi:uncharacterized protein YcfJ
VGATVGGTGLGDAVGQSDGEAVGGSNVGAVVGGANVGELVGPSEGEAVGYPVGAAVGIIVGVGAAVGPELSEGKKPSPSSLRINLAEVRSATAAAVVLRTSQCPASATLSTQCMAADKLSVSSRRMYVL